MLRGLGREMTIIYKRYPQILGFRYSTSSSGISANRLARRPPAKTMDGRREAAPRCFVDETAVLLSDSGCLQMTTSSNECQFFETFQLSQNRLGTFTGCSGEFFECTGAVPWVISCEFGVKPMILPLAIIAEDLKTALDVKLTKLNNLEEEPFHCALRMHLVLLVPRNAFVYHFRLTKEHSVLYLTLISYLKKNK